MRKLSILLLLFSFIFSFGQKIPEALKTEFTEGALEQNVTNWEDKEVSLASVFEKHKGSVIVLEFWAGWCRDCLVGMPAAHKLKEDNPEVDFIYLSLDRNLESWKKGVEKYGLTASDSYWFSSGWKNTFTDYIDLNWVPRYMVISQKGKIAKYYAVAADDPEIQLTIDKLLSENK